ncbi:hypothetical protein E6H17_06325 [Candidatus Bathyarchaeota archaeon]|nr:MAG: hypothetical protein E6H17_06325 [Candidatus Bathyarchaeota archaeon]TMI76483.1 MAG: hypothetical protein E6H11_00505 [Candidatus Bathyarchaeota archaeon]
MRLSLVLPVALIVLLSVVQFPTVHSQSPQLIPQQGFGLNRSASLTVKIVFLGITPDELNSTYLKRNVTVPPLKYQTILAGPLNTGVIFSFNYQLVFADNSTVSSFARYLSSIQREENTFSGPLTPSGLVNPYFTNSSTLSMAQNYFYDADKVESWLGSNMTLFGGNPVSGYTLFVADLHSYKIPSFNYTEYQNYVTPCRPCTPQAVQAHYYNRTVTDPDLGLVMYRHFMTGWGGSSRFYYMDLSAGPSYWTNELPVQVASQLRGISTSNYYGKLWMSKFVGSYVYGAVNNLFAPDQLYPVNYSQNYNLQLFVLDNRTAAEMSQGPQLTATINETMIQQNLASLVPFAGVTVHIKFANVTDYPGLAAIMANATTSLRDLISGRPIVDGDLVYNWFTTSGLGHITNFINVTRTTSTIDVPAFLFAFKGNYTFGVPVKEDIGSPNIYGTFGGEALGDMVLIGLSQQADFTIGNNSTYGQGGKGAGFTHDAIHELGHMMGLNHPFIYDLTEDFTNTVMGYYAYSLNFSQFDRDSILRGVNDELLSFALQALSTTQNTLFNAGDISMANQNIAKAENLYNTMDYAGAVQYSLAAAEDASAAQQLANSAISPALVFSLIGVAIGTAIGILLGYLLFRRSRPAGVQYNRCPTCQQPLRWDPAQMRWYCDRCQKPV